MSDEHDGGSGAVAVERRSPEAVFGLLGDDNRLSILRALGETPDEAVPFAELHRRSAVDDSGQFNYHLGKLRGTFVRRTDEGYELTHAGRLVVGAMYAGLYTVSATVDPIPVDTPCPRCDGEVVIEYAAETAHTRCTDCDEFRNEFSFPPGALDQFDREELPFAFDRWMRHVVRQVVGGFCNVCAGRVEGRLVVDEAGDAEWLAGAPAHAEFACGRCGSTATTSAATPAIFHPAVQGFMFDHGHDSTTDLSWAFGDVRFPEVTLEGRDPIQVSVRFESGADSITATLEADATVSGVERTFGA